MTNKINYNVIGKFTHNSNDIRGLEVYEHMKNKTLTDDHKKYLKLSWLRIAKLSTLSSTYVLKKWYYDFIYNPNNFELNKFQDELDEVTDNYQEIIENELDVNYDESTIFKEFQLNEKDFINSDIILLKSFEELLEMDIRDFIDSVKLDDSYTVHYFESQNIDVLKDIKDKINWKYWNMSFDENLTSLNENILDNSTSLINLIKFINIEQNDENKIDLNEQDENTIYELLENGKLITDLRYDGNDKEKDIFENIGNYFKVSPSNSYELKIKGKDTKSEVIVSYEDNIADLYNYNEQCSLILNLEEDECENFIKDLSNETKLKTYLESDKIFKIFNLKQLYFNFRACLDFIDMMLNKLKFRKNEKNIYFFAIPYGNAVVTEILSETYHKKKIKYYENFDSWSSHQTLFNDLSKLDNFKNFINKCIEFINNVLAHLNPDIINNDEINILNKFKHLKDIDLFYSKLNKNFKDNRLKENMLDSLKLRISFNKLNLVGIMSSINDKNSNDLLVILNSLLNLN